MEDGSIKFSMAHLLGMLYVHISCTIIAYYVINIHFTLALFWTETIVCTLLVKHKDGS